MSRNQKPKAKQSRIGVGRLMDLFQWRHWQRIALAVGLQIAIARKEQVAFHPDRWAAVANTDAALAAGCYHGIYPGPP